ncbi:junction resolvase [Moumouvirus goulette]|uniref:Junction resolvase n=1 Tax=Moumouvirus goulette TaxID=1247379 RepID=M1PBS5_9VIRU|nr:junction resolvase [Moumouvirus goulette]AGF85389.1 junction resolvase [Moumouvirus goulette]
MIVKKFPTSQLQLNLVKKLDELSEHFAKLKIQEVIIENQPSQKNPKMKSIANTLFDYFMIRGYIDKIHDMNIQLVKFMCPSNKLKVNNDNTLEVFKANKDSKKKYKLTKNLSIEYTRKLLSNDKDQLDYLSLHQKEDDMCDAYLQGRYYLEFIRFKENNPKFNSKTTKKPKKSNKSSKKNIESVKKITKQTKTNKKYNVIVL